MPLFSLPNELLLDVGKHLHYQSDLYALSLVNRHLHTLLNSLLYTRDADDPEVDYAALSWAARTGNLPTARRAIDAGAYPRETIYRSSQLSAAAHNGHINIVQLLLDQAAEHPQQPFVTPKRHRPGIMRRGNVGRNPIVHAAQSGHAGIVRLLLAREEFITPNLIVPGDPRPSPLAAAVNAGHLEVVQVLVRAGAGVMPRERAPLPSAATKGHLDIVQFLVQEGNADPNAAIDHAGGETLVVCAAMNGHLHVLEFLVDKAGADLSPDGWSPVYPLEFPGVFNHGAVVDFLLERKNYLDIAGDWEDTDRTLVLSVLAACGKTELLREALSRGWDPNAGFSTVLYSTRHPNLRPLLWAAGRGHTDAVKVLLAYGANAGWASLVPSPRRETAMERAVEGGHADVVSVLLDHGVKVYAWSRNEESSVLVLAIPCEPIFRLLLLDPRVQIGDQDGAALVTKVIEGGTAAQLRLLLERGMRAENNENKSLAQQVAERDASIFTTLLEYGYDFEPLGSQEDQDVLMAATNHQNVDMLRWLIRRGFQILRPSLGSLIACAAMGSDEQAASQALDLLLGPSRTTDERDQLLGGALLHLAGSKISYPAGIRLLLDRGADPLVGNELSGCPLELAANAGHYQVMDMLLQAIRARNAPVEVVKRQITQAKSQCQTRNRRGFLRALDRFYWRTVYPVEP